MVAILVRDRIESRNNGRRTRTSEVRGADTWPAASRLVSRLCPRTSVETILDAAGQGPAPRSPRLFLSLIYRWRNLYHHARLRLLLRLGCDFLDHSFSF